MNLCSFCRHYVSRSDQCRILTSFKRPSRTRVFHCTKFEQYPISFAEMRFSSYDGVDVGCIGEKASPPIPKKNQVVFILDN